MSDFIPVNEPLLDGNEKKYLAECIDTGWISSEGPFVTKFEAEFSARLNRKHGIAVANGTAAIDVAVEALGIGPGDEVILPTFTIISCIQQIVRAGAKPVLVDVDPLSWNMDVRQIEAKLSEHTKAILVVHIYGLPVDMEPVMRICKKYNIKLIEDAAEAIGQTYRGRPCGSFGDISTVSFYPNKHITTGEGGMVLTNDSHLATTCRSLRNLCFEQKQRFVHERLGWNMRMTNLQAALGLAQLERLDQFLLRKRRIGNRYQELLCDLKGVQLPLRRTDYADNLYWVFGLVLDKRLGDAESMMRRLRSAGIGTRPFFYPMHKQPVFLKTGLFKDESHCHSERLSLQGFYIPSGLNLNDHQLVTTANALKTVLSTHTA